MLAETFEDPRMKFIAEKVRHNPVEMAYHAEGPNWELYATSAGKTKFWGRANLSSVCLSGPDLFPSGKSLEIIPLGTTHLKIGNDHYQWFEQVLSSMNVYSSTIPGKSPPLLCGI